MADDLPGRTVGLGFVILVMLGFAGVFTWVGAYTPAIVVLIGTGVLTAYAWSVAAIIDMDTPNLTERER